MSDRPYNAGWLNVQRDGKPVAGAEPGNRRAVSHGAFSDRLVGPMLPEIRDGLEELVEGTPAAAPAFSAARAVLATKLARLKRVREHLDEKHGGSPLTTKGGVLIAARLELELAQSVEKSLAELGLTPTSAARLGVDLGRASSLADELARRDLEDARRLRVEAERRLEDEGQRQAGV